MLYINGIIKTYNKIENRFCHRGKWVYCDPFMDKILELVTSNKEYKFKSYKKMLEYLKFLKSTLKTMKRKNFQLQ